MTRISFRRVTEEQIGLICADLMKVKKLTAFLTLLTHLKRGVIFPLYQRGIKGDLKTFLLDYPINHLIFIKSAFYK